MTGRGACLRPYAAVLSARLRTLLQYRAAALAGFATQLFWGFLKIMVLEAFFRARPEAQPMSFAAVVNHVWLGQALLGMFPWNLDRDVDSMVRTGTVAYDLLRPIDAYAHWYARALGWRIASPALRAPPLLLVAAGLLPALGLGRCSWLSSCASSASECAATPHPKAIRGAAWRAAGLRSPCHAEGNADSFDGRLLLGASLRRGFEPWASQAAGGRPGCVEQVGLRRRPESIPRSGPRRSRRGRLP